MELPVTLLSDPWSILPIIVHYDGQSLSSKSLSEHMLFEKPSLVMPEIKFGTFYI